VLRSENIDLDDVAIGLDGRASCARRLNLLADLGDACLTEGMTNETKTVPGGAEIHLEPHEALVLFELLSRWSEPDQARAPSATCFESTAECAVLHLLLGHLEKQLVAPFAPDYRRLLEQARSRLGDAWDHPTLSG